MNFIRVFLEIDKLYLENEVRKSFFGIHKFDDVLIWY